MLQILEELQREFNVCLEGSDHLMVDGGVKCCQELVTFFLFFQLPIQGNVGKGQDLTLFSVEQQINALDDDRLTVLSIQFVLLIEVSIHLARFNCVWSIVIFANYELL